MSVSSNTRISGDHCLFDEHGIVRDVGLANDCHVSVDPNSFIYECTVSDFRVTSDFGIVSYDGLSSDTHFVPDNRPPRDNGVILNADIVSYVGIVSYDCILVNEHCRRDRGAILYPSALFLTSVRKFVYVAVPIILGPIWQVQSGL